MGRRGPLLPACEFPVMGATVADVNRAFQARKMAIQLPYPEDWFVKDMQILEKKDTAGTVKVLLAVELIREGKLIRDTCYLEGRIERGQTRGSAERPSPEKKKYVLPVRDRIGFATEGEAFDHLKGAFSSLLQEHDYSIEEHPRADVYGVIGKRGFFAMLAARCDRTAEDRARHLIELRKEYKHVNDYGLVVPAFQEPLGVPLSQQEAWVQVHVDSLSSHRVGIYGVDNADPNRIYPFTVYPQVTGLLRYFVTASRQWMDVRAQYILSRGDKDGW
jgi:hypothetical protein